MAYDRVIVDDETEITMLTDDEEVRPLERELPWLVNIRHYGQDAHCGGNGQQDA